jgi:hypothetical protein
VADFITAAMLRLRRKQDGMAHNRTSPGRNSQAVSRNRCRKRTVSSDRTQTAKQASADFVFFEVCGSLSGRTTEFQQIETLRYLALRQQLHRQEEEALSEERTPQSRHGVSVPNSFSS